MLEEDEYLFGGNGDCEVERPLGAVHGAGEGLVLHEVEGRLGALRKQLLSRGGVELAVEDVEGVGAGCADAGGQALRVFVYGLDRGEAVVGVRGEGDLIRPGAHEGVATEDAEGWAEDDLELAVPLGGPA